MSAEKRSKLNLLMSMKPSGAVLLSYWLRTQGYSDSLLKNYVKSGWLVSIGQGAFLRSEEQANIFGGVYSLQVYRELPIHVGGRSALALLGSTHYLELDKRSLILFGAKGKELPKWFREYDWGVRIEYEGTGFLSPEQGLIEHEVNGLKIRISGKVRALMECLHLAPKNQDLRECYELMEGLNNCLPSEVQLLLENCSSIKVKRLFLFLAEKIEHAWFHHLDFSLFDLGSGKRSVFPKGKFDGKYKITVPKEWIDS